MKRFVVNFCFLLLLVISCSPYRLYVKFSPNKNSLEKLEVEKTYTLGTSQICNVAMPMFQINISLFSPNFSPTDSVNIRYNLKNFLIEPSQTWYLSRETESGYLISNKDFMSVYGLDKCLLIVKDGTIKYQDKNIVSSRTGEVFITNNKILKNYYNIPLFNILKPTRKHTYRLITFSYGGIIDNVVKFLIEDVGFENTTSMDYDLDHGKIVTYRNIMISIEEANSSYIKYQILQDINDSIINELIEKERPKIQGDLI